MTLCIIPPTPFGCLRMCGPRTAARDTENARNEELTKHRNRIYSKCFQEFYGLLPLTNFRTYFYFIQYKLQIITINIYHFKS